MESSEIVVVLISGFLALLMIVAFRLSMPAPKKYTTIDWNDIHQSMSNTYENHCWSYSDENEVIHPTYCGCISCESTRYLAPDLENMSRIIHFENEEGA